MRSPITADTCISFIKRCTTSKALDNIHASMYKSGLSSNIFFTTNLISHYASLNSISKSHSLFTSTTSSSSDIFLVNVMLRAFVDSEEFHHTLLLYRDIRRLGENKPDHFTFPFVLKAAGYVDELAFGCGVHCDVVRFGYIVDVVVCNSVIGMYGKCGRIDLARQVFDEMLELKNSVTWSSMIGAYAENGSFKEGFSLFRSMEVEDIWISRSILLNAMACVSDEIEAHSTFRLALVKRYDSDQLVQTTAIRMFARVNRIDLSRSIFRRIVNKDVVTWSSMIEAYVLTDSPVEAFKHFIEMRLNGLRPDHVTFISLIRACSITKSLNQARLIHGIIIRLQSTTQVQVSLGTALINLYIKSGSIKHARITFDQMHKTNSLTWCTIISGYGTHGNGHEALRLHNQMLTKLKPDHITFISILSACSHSGLVSQGLECFKSMERDFKLTPRLEHYACVIDMLGRAGKLHEARSLIDGMGVIKPGVCVWGSLLSACRIHSDYELAEEAVKGLVELDGCNAGRYVVLANVYASMGKEEEAEKVRKVVKERKLKKCVGQAFV